MEQAIINLANLVDILTKRMIDENNRLREENEVLLEEINRLHVNKKIEQAQQIES
jgi:hypothetical protein